TLLFAGTIYAAAWLAFYVPLVARVIYDLLVNTVQNFGYLFENMTWARWYEIPLSLISYVLMLFSGTLIVLMPVAAPIIAGKAWLRSLKQASSPRAAALTAALPLAATIALLLVAMRQPQQTAFALLKDPPANLQQAESLVKREEQIRAGLLNAYLASFRYISAQGEVRHISDMYVSSFRMTSDTAWKIEQAYEFFLRPFLYTPVHAVQEAGPDSLSMTTDQEEAAVLYQKFFDRPIADGERSKIVDAVRANSNASQAELAWQVVDDREVHLNRQEVTLSEHGDWADVQMYEVYENVTSQRQEVVYYFNLPESAVITGLWLGSNSDRSKAFAFQVAPRGAAQAVYRNEIRYQRDPALIEQIGPRQYRLRAFPVEPRRWVGGAKEWAPGPELHLWMTYRTLAEDGAWPLPQLAQKFNVYWNGDSTRLLNGKPMQAGASDWLPASAKPTQVTAAATHRVDFPGGMSVVARPAGEAAAAALPANLRLAVVLDRSFSMRERAGEVKQAIDQVRKVTAGGPEPEIYLTASTFRGEQPSKVGLASLDPEQVFYFGGQNAAELLAQFEELGAGQAYDLGLGLTDGTGYELGQGATQVKVPEMPVWLVHLGGGFPLGYDDATLQAIQASGGGAAASVNEALARYAVAREAPGRLDLVDGYLWETLPTSQAGAQAADDPGFAALAARRVVLAEMAANHGSLDQLPVLDQIHNLAVEQGIVTPYSSMIVLVDPAQRELLKNLNQRDDRFDREVETIGKTTQANPFAVTGVPEPEEWLLIILAVIGLALVARRQWAQRTLPGFRPGRS
nr:TIGR02921 family PEP-CTERM protein [Anaerolinea sp.]